MGTFPLTSTFPGRMVFVLIILYAALLYYADTANSAYRSFVPDPETYSIIEVEGIIGDYQKQLDVLNEQIHDTRKDLEWLIVKINGISGSDMNVSKLLRDSVEFKERKIHQLERQKKHLVDIVATYRKIYDIKMVAEKKAAKVWGASTQDSIDVSSISDSIDGEPKYAKFDIPATLPDIVQAVEKAGLGDWVDVEASDGSCTKMSNSLPILFSSGSAVLAKEYKSFLRKLAQFLKPYDVKVYVNGYADTDPIHTKRYPSNFELGAFRATNVVHEMVRNGLRPDIFKIGSTGEYRFEAKKQSSTKSFQRRAQLTVVFSG